MEFSASTGEPRKLKAAVGIVFMTCGFMSAIAAWPDALGDLPRPKYSAFVGDFVVVVREIVSNHIISEEGLHKRVEALMDRWEKEFSPEDWNITTHILRHLPGHIELTGPAHGTWLFPWESFYGKCKESVKTRSQPVASIMNGMYTYAHPIFTLYYPCDHHREWGITLFPPYAHLVPTLCSPYAFIIYQFRTYTVPMESCFHRGNIGMETSDCTVRLLMCYVCRRSHARKTAAASSWHICFNI